MLIIIIILTHIMFICQKIKIEMYSRLNFSFNVFAVIREHFVSGNIIIQLNSSLVDKIYLLG